MTFFEVETGRAPIDPLASLYMNRLRHDDMLDIPGPRGGPVRQDPCAGGSMQRDGLSSTRDARAGSGRRGKTAEGATHPFQVDDEREDPKRMILPALPMRGNDIRE